MYKSTGNKVSLGGRLVRNVAADKRWLILANKL